VYVEGGVSIYHIFGLNFHRIFPVEIPLILSGLITIVQPS